MTRTGWIGEDPEPGPAMPVTNILLGMKQRRPGDTFAQALARSDAADAREARDKAAGARDPDDYAAGLVTRGYSPGLLNELSQRLGDTLAELADEEDKLEKAARRHERAMREHVAGRIDVFRMMQAMDGDDGDENRVRQLARRAESLKKQIAEAQDMIAPPQRRDLDPVEAAVSRAHQAFVEVTRQRMADAEARRPAPRPGPRPFGFASRGAAGTEHTGPGCQVCAEGRRREAADPGPYPPGAVITTGYREVVR